jgi:hypothetical protein
MSENIQKEYLIKHEPADLWKRYRELADRQHKLELEHTRMEGQIRRLENNLLILFDKHALQSLLEAHTEVLPTSPISP